MSSKEKIITNCDVIKDFTDLISINTFGDATPGYSCCYEANKKD